MAQRARHFPKTKMTASYAIRHGNPPTPASMGNGLSATKSTSLSPLWALVHPCLHSILGIIKLNINAGCRLPGEVKSAADLWQLLKDEKSGHGKVPKERWNIDAFYHENGGEKIGSMSMVCNI